MNRIEKVMTVLLAVLLCAGIVWTLSQIESVPRWDCPEDSARITIGTGDYEHGEWTEYYSRCIPLDDIFPVG
jgi:hypothetical protein